MKSSMKKKYIRRRYIAQITAYMLEVISFAVLVML